MFIVFFLVVGAIGYVISAYYGDPSFLIFADHFQRRLFVYQLLFLRYDRASKMARAVPIKKKDNPMYWDIVENLCIADGLPMPQDLYNARDADQCVCDGTRSASMRRLP